MTDDGCAECRIAQGSATALGLASLRLGGFLVHPRLEAPPVPGWMIVAPARHVEQIDALTADELSALGPLLARVAAALRAATPTEKVYLSVFAEVLPHLHVHVVARPPELRPEARGARIFLAADAGGQTEASVAVARAVYASLSA